jgi:hypothetical protein
VPFCPGMRVNRVRIVRRRFHPAHVDLANTSIVGSAEMSNALRRATLSPIATDITRGARSAAPQRLPNLPAHDQIGVLVDARVVRRYQERRA